ncbi:MAG TPA: hypothetical protein VKV26_14150 [Dehalococcoidia bacterium]|nr:hypothetical protein [Dehalococcoidia bacterium]
MTTMADLYRLIDSLPDELAEAAARRLEELQGPEQLAQELKQRLPFDQLCELVAWLQEGLDPVRQRLLTAPFDDEPETEEEREAVAEAYEDLRSGRVISGAEARRELGL